MKKADVLVIGAGLLGSFTARNLTKYEMDVLVLEKESDVSRGISKANTGILYAGYDHHPGSLKSRLCAQANRDFDLLARELDVPFTRPGSLMFGGGPRADRVIERKYRDGLSAGVNGLRLLTGSEAKDLEPGLSCEISSALYAESTGTVDPWEICIAAYENAADNGAEFRFGEQVLSLRREDGGFVAETEKERYFAKAVVNAAGLKSDRIRELVEKPLIRLFPTAADYIVLDTSEKGKIRHILFHESENGKGLTLVPTVDGNILLGPTEREPEGGEAAADGLSVSADGLSELLELCGKIAPSLDLKKQIRAFGSLRPNPYRVREESGVYVKDESIRIRDLSLLDENGLFSLIGVKTPGLTLSNAIGSLTADKAAAFTGRSSLRKDFNPYRKAILRTRSLSYEERAALIEKDPAYGEIVCGCMEVSLAEILEAIKRGARDFEAVKRRTGAGMGRCQGSRCQKRVMDILHYERSLWQDN